MVSLLDEIAGRKYIDYPEARGIVLSGEERDLLVEAVRLVERLHLADTRPEMWDVFQRLLEEK